MNVVDFCPAGTVICDGKFAIVGLLARKTVTPPAGATNGRVTVAVDVWESSIVEGLRLNPGPEGGSIVSSADELPLTVLAPTVTDVANVTPAVLTVKVAVVLPEGTVTVAGIPA